MLLDFLQSYRPLAAFTTRPWLALSQEALERRRARLWAKAGTDRRMQKRAISVRGKAAELAAETGWTPRQGRRWPG